MSVTITAAKRLFTVDEYYRMLEAGILTEDDRVELIEGEIVAMPPIGSPHASAVKRLNRQFCRQVGRSAIVSVQDPVRLGRYAEPVPDLALLAPRKDDYALGHPGPDDALLIVEVADTTLPYDRKTKLPLYARAGIREVWIVNLPEEVLEVYREPTGAEYRDCPVKRPGEVVAPVALPGMRIRVGVLFGRTR